jgi:hypothetical protein
MPSSNQNVNQFAFLAINNESEFTGSLTDYSIGINKGEKSVNANFTCAGIFEDKSPILEFFNGKSSANITITVTNTLNSEGETTRTITLNKATCLSYIEIWDSNNQKIDNMNDLLVNFIVTAESATLGGVDFPA